ncbi:MAG: YraN family protein [Flavobacteriaceae bacterium]
MAEHNALGELGEQMAFNFLKKEGYTIVEKNWRFKKAEIDLIVQKKDTLICVEVKTRSTDFFGDPQDFIDAKKIKLLVGAMNEYVESNDLDVDVRFDVIAIIHNKYKTKLEHFEDAFWHFY